MSFSTCSLSCCTGNNFNLEFLQWQMTQMLTAERSRNANAEGSKILKGRP
jgi:hypothetical protein